MTRTLVGLCALLALGFAQAEPAQTHTFDTTAPLTIASVTNFGAPSVLAGARALAFFADGGSEAAAFDTSGGNAFAQGSSFVVVAQARFGDNSQPDWTITNLSTTRTLVGFALDGHNGGAGHAAFDTNFGANLAAEGTPGSAGGATLLMNFSGRSFITGSVAVSYSRPLALDGAAAVGDLFARVDVALAYGNNGLNGGLPPTTQFGAVFSSQAFRSDVDTVSYVATPVPEPAGAALLLAGVAVLAAARRREARRRG